MPDLIGGPRLGFGCCDCTSTTPAACEGLLSVDVGWGDWSWSMPYEGYASLLYLPSGTLCFWSCGGDGWFRYIALAKRAVGGVDHYFLVYVHYYTVISGIGFEDAAWEWGELDIGTSPPVVDLQYELTLSSASDSGVLAYHVFITFRSTEATEGGCDGTVTPGGCPCLNNLSETITIRLPIWQGSFGPYEMQDVELTYLGEDDDGKKWGSINYGDDPDNCPYGVAYELIIPPGGVDTCYAEFWRFCLDQLGYPAGGTMVSPADAPNVDCIGGEYFLVGSWIFRGVVTP